MLPKPSYIGKVRDVYDLGDSLLLSSSDRISAFDCVFQELIPGKGVILNTISNRWFKSFNSIENHIIETDYNKFPAPFNSIDFKDRATLVKKCKRIDYECVVRGYISGSLWKEYSKGGTLNFIPSCQKYLESDKLSEPLFTPARKNDTGHDENISEQKMRDEIGEDIFNKLKDLSFYLYTTAEQKMKKSGIILCDTKFEFGFLNDNIILIDEVLTPDSSRYWAMDEYSTGISPPSFDKQILRNYLETLDWNKEPPTPKLPENIINKIINKYKEIQEKILSCT